VEIERMRGDEPGRRPGRNDESLEEREAEGARVRAFPSDAEYVEPSEVARLRGEGVALVDLRAPEAFAAAHLPGAVNLPAADLIGRPAAALGAAILYDDDGGLIAERCDALRSVVGEMEFFVLRGGLAAWRRAGLPVEGDERR
jgi:3-mercaptopyruvate sulfurtransferase SseA